MSLKNMMKTSKVELLKEKIKNFEEIGFKPVGRTDLPAFQISVPFDWGMDPYKDNNWCFQVNTLRYLMIYADIFNLTKESSYIEKLLEYIKDWSEFSKNNPNNFAWHDMATGIRAEKIGYVIDVLKDNNFTVPNWLNEIVISHVNKMREKGFINLRHNHGLYVIHGLRALSKHVGPGMRNNVLIYTKKAITVLFKSQFDENFVHKEHSPHYHHLVTETMKKYIKTGLYDDVEFLKNCYKKASDNQKYFYLPDGREVPFGDTDGAYSKSKVDLSIEKNDWSFFNKSGYFFYKNIDNSYLSMTNSHHSSIHKHDDNLSLILGHKGNDILTDPGKYKYTNDEIRQRILSSETHSVLNFRKRPWNTKDIVKPLTNFNLDEFEEYFTVNNSLSLELFDKNLKTEDKVLIWNRKVIRNESGFAIIIDKINRKVENLVVRFTLDPSQILTNTLDVTKPVTFYKGKSFDFYSYSINNNELNLNSVNCNEVPVSKEYGSYIMTHQLEIDMEEKECISILILNDGISINKVLSFLNSKSIR